MISIRTNYICVKLKNEGQLNQRATVNFPGRGRNRNCKLYAYLHKLWHTVGTPLPSTSSKPPMPQALKNMNT